MVKRREKRGNSKPSLKIPISFGTNLVLSFVAAKEKSIL